MAELTPLPMQADLLRFADLDPGGTEGVAWSAVWGVNGHHVGFENSDDDLRALVDEVVEDARRWVAAGVVTPREGYHVGELVIQWTIGGDRGSYPSVAAAIAATGVTLPASAAEWTAGRVADGTSPEIAT
ncbi:MAG: hypothetical protein ACRDRW_20355 [Pseudonocardiaceae bacterium]